MPKIVDHAARRAELAAAVWRLVARVGVEGASVRAVAAESGWSPGAVRHYFASHDDLLRFAMATMGERVPERVRGILATQPGGPDRAQAVLEQLLPLDEERMGEALVYVALLGRARIDPAFAEPRRVSWDGERVLCRLAVADAAGRPDLVDRLLASAGAEEVASVLPQELEAEAERLHVLVDGLTLVGATVPAGVPAVDLRRLLRDALDRLTDA